MIKTDEYINLAPMGPKLKFTIILNFSGMKKIIIGTKIKTLIL